MSNEEHNEYMKNVRWTTGLYVFGSTISIVLAMAGVYYGLKGDIKDTRTEDREQIQSVSNRLNSKIDSLQNYNVLQFQEIRQQFESKAESHSTSKLFTEKWVSGKLTFIPIK